MTRKRKMLCLKLQVYIQKPAASITMAAGCLFNEEAWGFGGGKIGVFQGSSPDGRYFP